LDQGKPGAPSFTSCISDAAAVFDDEDGCIIYRRVSGGGMWHVDAVAAGPYHYSVGVIV
jgi:hypothetical protein